MKKISLKFNMVMVIAFLSTIVLTSCSDEEEPELWTHDFTPVEISFEIVDSEGKDLIANGCALYHADFSISYNNKKYNASWIDPWVDGFDKLMGSRAYLPRMFGLFYKNSTDKEYAKLIFGELDGDIGEADVVLEMPDGTNHKVHISRHLTVKGPDVNVKQTVTLDGKTIDSLTDGSPWMNFRIKANQ